MAPEVDERYAPAIARIEKLIAHEMKDKGLPAVSIALVDDQRIVWSKGFGYADPAKKLPATADTVYRVGSVSKLFTDIAVMQLVERGEVDLDAPVTTYLPAFKPTNPFGTPITLRHLMSHRAGLVREPPVGHYFDDTAPTLAATVDSLNRTTLVYAPGTRTKYSNAGIAVVGRVLEVIAKRPFADALRDRVLEPLGLQKSAFEPSPAVTKDLAKAFMWTYHGTRFDAPTFQLGMAPAGSMYSTVNDLGRFMSTLFQRGATLKPETLEAMWAPQFSPPRHAQRLRPRVRRVVLRRSAARRPQRRDLRVRDRRAGAAGQQAGRRDCHDARLHQSRDGAHRPGSAARDDARARQAAGAGSGAANGSDRSGREEVGRRLRSGEQPSAHRDAASADRGCW